MERISWIRQAQKRAENRTFVLPVDRKGRPILSFWLSQAPRPEVEDVEAEEV